MAGRTPARAMAAIPAAATRIAPAIITRRQPDPSSTTCTGSPAGEPVAPAAPLPAVTEPAADPAPEPLAGAAPERPAAASAAAAVTRPAAIAAMPTPSAIATAPVSLRNQPRVAITAARLANAATARAAIAGRTSCAVTAVTVSGSG